MEKKLTAWTKSDYVISLSITDEDKARVRTHVLNHFAKDMKVPGFRVGKVPMHIVEQNIQPAYLEMAIVEHLVNDAIQEVLEENASIKFIGEPYGYDTKTEKWVTKVSFHLDVYPEVSTDGKKRESIKMKAIKVEATDQEIEDSLLNIQKNYADYKDTDTISDKNTLSKLWLEFVDKKWEAVDKWTAYLGETEFNEDKFWSKTFNGKKKDEVIELAYDEKKLPQVFHAKHWEPKTLKVTVKDVKEVVLPELNDKMIGKLFWEQAEVKTYDELRAYIKNEILKQKQDSELIKTIEDYLNDIRKAWLNVIIPETIINQEFNTRMQNLKERFGSQEKVSEYFKQLWEEKSKAFVEEVKKAATESLEKFFILNKVTEHLWIKIDWTSKDQDNLFVEKEIYNKLVWELPNAEGKKEPAKKATKKATKKEEK